MGFWSLVPRTRPEVDDGLHELLRASDDELHVLLVHVELAHDLPEAVALDAGSVRIPAAFHVGLGHEDDDELVVDPLLDAPLEEVGDVGGGENVFDNEKGLVEVVCEFLSSTSLAMNCDSRRLPVAKLGVPPDGWVVGAPACFEDVVVVPSTFGRVQQRVVSFPSVLVGLRPRVMQDESALVVQSAFTLESSVVRMKLSVAESPPVRPAVVLWPYAVVTVVSTLSVEP
jgi:hypothetical protein